jgi:hypothetical protein
MRGAFPAAKEQLDKTKQTGTPRRNDWGGTLNDPAGFSARATTGQKTSVAPLCPSRVSVPVKPGALA